MTFAPYAHIACCVDDSPDSERALEEARRLGGFGAGRLTIVHVAEAPIIYGEGLGLPPEDEIADVASAWLRETALGIDGADSVLLFWPRGQRSVCVGEARRRRPARGGRAPRAARASALGSFASYVAYHAPCPVLVVRPDTS